jgi:hypothetical protein
MADLGTGVLVIMVNRIDQAACIDGQLARRGARMALSPSGRARQAGGRVATQVQHLPRVLQGMRCAVCVDPVIRSADAAPRPSTHNIRRIFVHRRSLFVQSRSYFVLRQLGRCAYAHTR